MFKLIDKQIKAFEKVTGLKHRTNGCMDGIAYKFGKPITLVFGKDGTFEMFDRRVCLIDKNTGEETYDSVPIPIEGIESFTEILDMKMTRKELRDKYIKYGIIIPLDRNDGIKNGMPLPGKYDCSSCKKHNCNIMMGGDEHGCYRCGSNAGFSLYIPGHTDVDYKKLEEEIKESR